MRVWGMRTGVTVQLSPTDRKRLQAIVDDRNSPQKHVWRARIVLATTDGLGRSAIMRTAGVSKRAVWRWQARFMDEGVDGRLRDKTRPARVPKLADDVAERIVALTLAQPPGETTHWTGRVMAKVASVSLTSVQRIWKAHGLAPHRIRTFKLSNDPKFAAFDVLEGKVIGRCMQRHRHQEFIHFLNAVEGFFAVLAKRRLKRGVFKGVVDLQAAINRFVVDHNQQPKPFVWTADPDKIIAAASRGHQVLDPIH
jgi:transposase